MKNKKLIITLIFALFVFLPIAAEESPMQGWHNDEYLFSPFYATSYQYREQDGYALVLGKKIHYWLYDTITYKSYHGGDTAFIYNRVIPNWVEKMGYAIDYDNIYVADPNPDLANSVRALMKQRGVNISVTLITKQNFDTNVDYVAINEYFSSKNQYKCTIYYLYK